MFCAVQPLCFLHSASRFAIEDTHKPTHTHKTHTHTTIQKTQWSQPVKSAMNQIHYYPPYEPNLSLSRSLSLSLSLTLSLAGAANAQQENEVLFHMEKYSSVTPPHSSIPLSPLSPSLHPHTPHSISLTLSFNLEHICLLFLSYHLYQRWPRTVLETLTLKPNP